MLSDVVLETIRKLNEQPDGIQSNDFMQLIPVSIITSFLDKTGFNAATINFHSWNDAKIGKRIIKRTDFKQVEFIFSYQLKFSQAFLLERNKTILFATLSLYSERSLSSQEKKALEVFASFLSDYLENRILEVIARKIKILETKINYYLKPYSENINKEGLAQFWENDQIELNLTYDRTRQVKNRPGSIAEKIIKARHQ